MDVDGQPTEVLIRFGPRGATVTTGNRHADPESVGKVVRHWFDLDTDIEAVDRGLADQGRFTGQVRSRPGIRITRYPAVFEAAILTVLGQQVSLSAGRTFGGRLVTAYGEESGDLHRFPTPERLVEEPVERLRETLGVTGARANTLREVAVLFADDVRLDPATGSDSLRERLVALPGVGPWTVSCVSIRGLGEPDEFPVADAVLRRALGGASGNDAMRMAGQWSPWRSYATVRLWAEATGAG